MTDELETPTQLPGIEELALPAIPTRPVGGGPIQTVWGQAVHDALFGAQSLPDVRDGWRQTALPGTVALGDCARGDGGLSPLAGFSGAIVGIWYRTQTTITGGTLNIGAQAGGQQSALTAITSGSANLGVIMFASPVTFSASTAIRFIFSTASLLPAGSVTLNGGLIVRYDYIPG
jgi:hypothetical protein